MKKTLVSGIRPTGDLHLGNYFGGMKNLIALQDEYSAFYFIADIHSLTTHPHPEDLKQNVLTIAKNYLAAGLDPQKASLFAQSSIAPEVCELNSYLGMMMPLGELLRCPTFKEKAKKHPDNINYGLVGYPVLMASDILIHKGQIVSVGDDQLVHLELARTMVKRFNTLYGNVFVEPDAIAKNAVRIPSLSGKGKMSKSDGAETYISMDDENDVIKAKIKKAFSDPKRIYKTDAGHPTSEECNVFHLHSFFTDDSVLREIEKNCLNSSMGCVQCKQILSDSIISIVEPFREMKKEISDAYVIEVLTEGAKAARISAQKTIAEVRKAIGIQMF